MRLSQGTNVALIMGSSHGTNVALIMRSSQGKNVAPIMRSSQGKNVVLIMRSSPGTNAALIMRSPQDTNVALIVRSSQGTNVALMAQIENRIFYCLCHVDEETEPLVQSREYYICKQQKIRIFSLEYYAGNQTEASRPSRVTLTGSFLFLLY